MKRIVSVLAVAALMAVMLVAMAAPAFAKGQPPCKGTADPYPWPEDTAPDANSNGVACYNYKTGNYTDDRG
jgi:hypothetical protein